MYKYDMQRGDNMDLIQTLETLASTPAVSGREGGFAQTLKTMFEEYCDRVEVDKFYNVIGIKQGRGDNRKKIMVTAHMDEIGLLVKSIDERGFLKVTNIGGVDAKIMLAQEVVVHGSKDIIGIIGAKPPHLLKLEDAKNAVKLEDLSVDIGMNREKAVEYVSIGDVITLKPGLKELQNSKVSSKSLDNRCGVATLLEMMKELNKLSSEHDVYFVATAQEELHLTGVTTASYTIKPDAAIVIDVCHGDMPDAPKEGTYALGKGPAIAIGPNLHRKLTKRVMEIAKDENIPYQTDVEPGNTGTEAWATQVSREGIPTVLISIPLRYMHTTIETAHRNDIKNSARLAARFIAATGKEMEELLCC